MSTVETETHHADSATLASPYSYEEQTDLKAPVKLSAIDILALMGGVAIPAVTLITTTLCCAQMGTEMVFRHPVETLAQYALAVSIPIGNYVVWNRIKQQNFANLKRLGLLSGFATGSSALATAISLTASIMGTQCESGVYIDNSVYPHQYGLVAAISLVTSIYLMRKLCLSWATRGARTRQLAFSLAGIFLSLLILGLSEARQTVVKMAERATQSEDMAQRVSAMNRLHMPWLDASLELRRDILDPRSGGLSGMLFGIDPTATRQLYFNLTGTPCESIADLTANDGSGDSALSSSYDQYLAAQTIGEVIPGLNLKRSQIRGGINSRSLTANLEWTFVIQNKSVNKSEARAEIALPPGAVVSRLTLWQEGKPTDAYVSASNSDDMGHSSVENPATIRYIGKGRVLLQCRPAEHGNETKMSVTIVAPLKLDTENQASLTLPRLMASNFSTNINHDLHLLSNGNLMFSAADLHSITNAGPTKLYVGTIKAQEAKNAGLSLIASRRPETGTLSSRNTYAKNYTVERIQEVPNSVPRNLVVVVDGSKNIKEYKKEITDLLGKVQKITPTTVLVADEDSTEAPQTLSVDAAIKEINDTTFDGGHDNLPAVVKAGELAGQQNDSAVLWIHGPQPALNEEIYITSQAATKPSFYDLAIDDGWTNTSAFLKNHQDIGPMIPVARTGKLNDDLSHFLQQWQPGGHHYSVQITTQIQKPEGFEIDGQGALDLSILGAAHTCKDLIAQEQKSSAINLAIAAHIVSPGTSAAVLPIGQHQLATRRSLSSMATFAQMKPVASNSASNDSLSGFTSNPVEIVDNRPVLQCATNGTVGAQGADAAYITGVDTAGTVRVNNLANLEALLNIVANVLELMGITFGAYLLIDGCRKGFHVNKLVYAIASVLVGLGAPGLINWMCATARDANLFS